MKETLAPEWLAGGLCVLLGFFGGMVWDRSSESGSPWPWDGHGLGDVYGAGWAIR